MVGSDEDRTMWAIVALIVVVVVAVPAVMLVAMGLTGWDHDEFGMMGSWGGGWGLMMAIPGAALLIIILIIVLVAISDRPVRPAQAGVPYPAQFYMSATPVPGSAHEPLAILDRRLASGEVTVEEYSRIKSELLRR